MKQYKDYLTEELKKCELKLKEIEKNFGKNSERWHISNEYRLSIKNRIKHGIPKHIDQSTEAPYDLVEGF